MAILNTKNGEELLVLGKLPIPINSYLTNSYKLSVSENSKYNRVKVDTAEELKPKYNLQTFTDYTIELEVINDGGVGSELLRLIKAFSKKYSAYIDDKREVPAMCKYDENMNEIVSEATIKPTLLASASMAVKKAYEIGTSASYLGNNYMFFNFAIYNITSNVDENDPQIVRYTISCSDEYNASAEKNATTNVSIKAPTGVI